MRCSHETGCPILVAFLAKEGDRPRTQINPCAAMHNDRNHAPAKEPLFKPLCGAAMGRSVDCDVIPRNHLGISSWSPRRRPLFSSSWCRSWLVLPASVCPPRSRAPTSSISTPPPAWSPRATHTRSTMLAFSVNIRLATRGAWAPLHIHPPFEVAIYLAVAWLSLKSTYLLRSVFSLGFLALAARLLAKEPGPTGDRRICFAALLTFVQCCSVLC